MTKIKEFTPSKDPRPKTKYAEKKEITPNEEFQKRSAEREIQRRNESPIEIEDIFELINERKLTKERLEDFELDPELQTALKWVIDLLEKIDRNNQTIRDQEKLIDQLKSIIADLESKQSLPKTENKE